MGAKQTFAILGEYIRGSSRFIIGKTIAKAFEERDCHQR
jgi:hypothetical protein